MINALSTWIDSAPANVARDPEARLWGRVAKVSEEAGEVISALIAATGQNPRKGTTGTVEDVERELMDVALTAFAAVAHLHGNSPDVSVTMRFAKHVESVAERARV